MEDKEKKKGAKPQIFYFNEQGQLVVESNKGVWADGVQYVKMYGDFSCNAKTMGEIINKMMGIPVEVGVEEKIKVSTDNVIDDILDIHEHTILHYCVLGVDKARVYEYEEALAKQHYATDRMKSMAEELKTARKDIRESSKIIDNLDNDLKYLRKKIENYNKLPWWKRMFIKVSL